MPYLRFQLPPFLRSLDTSYQTLSSYLSFHILSSIFLKTVGSYIKKASDHQAGLEYGAIQSKYDFDKKYGTKSNLDHKLNKEKGQKDYDKEMKRAEKRRKGIEKATDNLTKESFQQFQEKCWKGYEKKGMKTMFGKRYPNCVKKTKSEEVEVDTSSAVS